jgi:hypothetical protein
VDIPDQRGGAEGSSSFPFEIISRIDPGSGNLQLGVIFDSHLFNSEDGDQYEEPNDSWGLLDVDETTGWFDVTTSDIGKKIWLEIELDESDQSILAINVRYEIVNTTDAWTFFPDPIEIDVSDPSNPGQQFWHQIIGEISNPDIDPREGSMILTIPGSSGTQIQVNQLLYENIMMTTGQTTAGADEPGVSLLVAQNDYGPATDTGGTGTEIPPQDNLLTPWQFGPILPNNYDFEMFDASVDNQAKVGINDGVLYAANNDGFDPQGMPADPPNSFSINVNDGDEVWLHFTYENDLNYQVQTCVIESGQTTPDDDPENNTAYVTLGNVGVDTSESGMATVYPQNEVCGDVEWLPPVLPTHNTFQIVDASNGGQASVQIYDGEIIPCNGDSLYPAGMPADNSYQIDVNDGDEVWVMITWDLEADDGVSGDNVASVSIGNGQTTPDDTDLVQYITLGSVDVNFDDNNNASVFPTHEHVGDIVITYPPSLDSDHDLALVVDKDTGNKVWKKVCTTPCP